MIPYYKIRKKNKKLKQKISQMSGLGRGYEGRERYQRKFTFTNQPQKKGQEKGKKLFQNGYITLD